MKIQKYIKLTESELVDAISYALGKDANRNKLHKLVKEEILFEDEDDEETESESDSESVDKVTDEQLRIDSLKFSIKIGKLFNKVTPEDMLEISMKVASYLKDHQVGTDYDPAQAGDEPTKSSDEKEEESVEVEETPEGENFEVEDIEDIQEPDGEESESANEESFTIPDEFIL